MVTDDKSEFINTTWTPIRGTISEKTTGGGVYHGNQPPIYGILHTASIIDICLQPEQLKVIIQSRLMESSKSDPTNVWLSWKHNFHQSQFHLIFLLGWYFLISLLSSDYNQTASSFYSAMNQFWPHLLIGNEVSNLSI